MSSNPKTFAELENLIREILPDAQIDENADGEIVIYSGLHEDLDGDLHSTVSVY